MAKQMILWTVLPHGRVEEGPDAGRLRVSVLVSPRLTPGSPDETRLGAFEEFLDWPRTLAGGAFAARIGPEIVGLRPLSKPDSAMWRKLFSEETPVEGFRYADMSRVNLRSFPIRTVLGTLRRHYGQLAAQATATPPTLLPWKAAHPDLKAMLTDLGTQTRNLSPGDRQIEVMLDGFSRFHGAQGTEAEKRLDAIVFGEGGVYRAPVPGPAAEEQGPPPTAGEAVRRALPPDWYDPRPGGPGAPLVARPDATVMAMFNSAAEYALWQADRFYRREPPSDAERRMRRPDFKGLPDPPKPPEYDFHRIVASFGDQPHLLRALGLVLDFALEDDAPIEARIAAGGGAGEGVISLVAQWDGGRDDSADARPKTAWGADKERFFTRPRGRTMARGLLRLEHADDRWDRGDKRSPFDVYQVDPDGAALKTVDFTLTAQKLVGKSIDFRRPDGAVTYTTGDKQGVAALRSAGLGVSHHGRAAEMATEAAASALKNAMAEGPDRDRVTLFAEDVFKGYRVDVADVPDETAPGRWRSLCAREGAFTLIASGEPLELPSRDEGHVSGASTASAETSPDDHYLHESLFRWTGWSLCAPRPGLTLRSGAAPGSAIQTETPQKVTDAAERGNGVRAEFHVARGSLPRLRFGHLYRMRARVVDAAGNSLALDDETLGALEQATDAVGYWRFEPVDPPALAHQARVSEGESLERMVIRSNWDQDAETYLADPAFAAAAALPASADFEYRAQNARHLVPPKASQQLCETHGAFDPWFSDPASIRKGYAIAAREEGSLFDAPPGAVVELVTPGALAGVATTSGLPPATPTPENPVGDRLAPGQYVIHREPSVETPWLPDPAAAGVALRAQAGHALPGVTQETDIDGSYAVRRAPNGELVIMVAHGEAWPYSQGFRLILAERAADLSDPPCAEKFPDDGAPRWDEAARTLTLFLPKGRVCRLLYSSFAHPDLVRTFGAPRWAQTAAGRGFAQEMATLGAAWQVTPHRPLTLVHATQQPVCAPELILLSASRKPGAQDADIACRVVRLHGPSTGQVEIEAEWGEWIDDINRRGPERVIRKGQLGEIRLAENHPNAFVLGDAVDAQQIDPARPRARGDVHALGDTRFHLIRYRARATTRFREYLPAEIHEDRERITRLGPVATGERLSVATETDPGAPVLPDQNGESSHTVVPASAPPDEPRVLYVLPTFRWSESASGATRRQTRLGGGLRVWLDRPWFSSGDGELLGVVIAGEGRRFTDIPAQMQTLVTQWGLDPVWSAALPKTRAGAADFPARVHVENARLLERPNDPEVTVVGHRVRWDTERHLWFCDIELDPGATYMPFVRLALARLQPHALQGAKISKVFLAEFAQVLPRRRATLTQQGAVVSATLHGPAPIAGPTRFPIDSEYQDVSFIPGPHESGLNRAELVLQTRDPEIDSDLAWRDEKVLADAPLGPGGIPIAGSWRAAFAGAPNPDSPGPAVAASAARPAATAARGVAATAVGSSVFAALDPVIWSGSATLPPDVDRPARLMLREFERYYTDDTIPEAREGRIRRRRVIEERLVYAAIFAL